MAKKKASKKPAKPAKVDQATVTSSFGYSMDGRTTQRYRPGDVATGTAAQFAVDNGFGRALAAQPAANKAKGAAPANKSA